MVNSPMFQSQKIKTLLLVAFSTNDDIIEWHQGIEMFISMRRIKKPYIMFVYDDKNHSLEEKLQKKVIRNSPITSLYQENND